MYENYNLKKNYTILNEKLCFISESIRKSLEEIDSIKNKLDNGYKIDGNTKRGLLRLENDLSVLNKRINKVLLLEVDKQIKLMNR